MAVQWLRSRLPRDSTAKEKLFREIIMGIQRQLSQEGRHMRRLHIVLQHLPCMVAGEIPGSDEEAEVHGMAREASDLVDQLVMIVGQDVPRERTVKDMLREAAGRRDMASSSGDQASSSGIPLLHQVVARWAKKLKHFSDG